MQKSLLILLDSILVRITVLLTFIRSLIQKLIGDLIVQTLLRSAYLTEDLLQLTNGNRCIEAKIIEEILQKLTGFRQMICIPIYHLLVTLHSVLRVI